MIKYKTEYIQYLITNSSSVSINNKPLYSHSTILDLIHNPKKFGYSDSDDDLLLIFYKVSSIIGKSINIIGYSDFESLMITNERNSKLDILIK